MFASTIDFVDADANGFQAPNETAIGAGVLAGKVENNGGKVLTAALRSNSSNPALDAGLDDRLIETTVGIDLNGDGDTTDTITNDARGVQRLVDLSGVANNAANFVDLGAYEDQNETPTLTSFTRFSPTEQVTAADTLVFRATFDEQVQNIDPADFDVNGGSTASVTGVAAVQGTGEVIYEITVAGGDPCILQRACRSRRLAGARHH